MRGGVIDLVAGSEADNYLWGLYVRDGLVPADALREFSIEGACYIVSMSMHTEEMIEKSRYTLREAA